jgi:hypothetical protein
MRDAVPIRCGCNGLPVISQVCQGDDQSASVVFKSRWPDDQGAGYTGVRAEPVRMAGAPETSRGDTWAMSARLDVQGFANTTTGKFITVPAARLIVDRGVLVAMDLVAESVERDRSFDPVCSRSPAGETAYTISGDVRPGGISMQAFLLPFVSALLDFEDARPP